MNTDNNSNKLIELCLQKENTVCYPILKDLYQFFSPRAKSITAVSFGMGEMGIETHLISSTGCKINICDSRPGKEILFNKYFNILKTHSAEENSTEWEKELSQRWILAKNITFSKEIPFTYSGSIDISGVITDLQKFSYERIDLCKIDYDDFNTSIVHAILNAGYRPGILLIHWNKHPDNFTDTMLTAGHLQSSGYRLVGNEGNWFLYLFTDNCIYETCSWARTDVDNPMIEEIKSVTITNLLNTTSNTLHK